MHLEFAKKEYLYKIIYLIRINIPSSELIYFIMFLFKYLGLFTLCTSLNNNGETTKSISQLSYSYYNNIDSLLKNFLITGNNLKMIEKNYQEICITGFLILIMYVVIIIYSVIHVKNKYYNEIIISNVDKKIKNINNSSKLEKKLFKIIAYILFVIVFFSSIYNRILFFWFYWLFFEFSI